MPDQTKLFIGREAECEEIIGKLASDHFRVGIIYGPLGIGKTSLAVEVGHQLLAKDWTVNYLACSDLGSSLEQLKVLIKSFPATFLKYDKRNETFSLKSHHSLLILDQVENLLEADQSAFVPKALHALLDPELETSSVKVLLVSRKEISYTDDLAFPMQLQPLSKLAAVQLLQNTSKISCEDDLGVIAKGCGCNPLALTFVQALINKGMSEKEIVIEMSTPEHFWKNLSYIIEKNHVLREVGVKMSQNGSLQAHLSNLLGIKSTVQAEMFLESWIEGKNCLQEEEDSYYKMASDPRYCHCWLCLTPEKKNKKKGFKVASRSTASSSGRHILVLIDFG